MEIDGDTSRARADEHASRREEGGKVAGINEEEEKETLTTEILD